jgi:hypothetical protein
MRDHHSLLNLAFIVTSRMFFFPLPALGGRPCLFRTSPCGRIVARNSRKSRIVITKIGKDCAKTDRAGISFFILED